MEQLLGEGKATVDLETLRQRDPRMKLLLLLLMIVGVFSVSDFSGLLLLWLPVLLVLWWRPEVFKLLARRLWFLRWLLLFTLVLHLLLTPGQTLLGTRLFSYDGLLRGVMVDLQLILALFFTLLFALSTSTGRIAWACMRLLRPLGKVGVNVEDLAEQLGLVLHFLPQVFAEGAALTKGNNGGKGRGISGRFELLASRVGDIVLGLVDLADRTAVQIAEGGGPQKFEVTCQKWVWYDSLWLLSGVLLLMISWSL